jgi:integrative and conjugative element protein (TIGR02256 family)
MIEYPIGRSGQALIFTVPVLESFSTHRQLRFWQREAGGQLFGRLDGSRIEVLEATGPRRTDRRTRTTYVPDRRAEQREIDDRFGRGLHFIGDWHSHPEKIPVPSYRDVSSLDDTVRRSSHSMLGLVLVIVGQLAAPEGLHVSIFHGDGAAVELKPHPRFCENANLTPVARTETFSPIA